MWNALIIGFAVTVAVVDLRYRKIPRQISLAAATAGLFFHAFNGGLPSALLALAVGLFAGLALYYLGAIGGGDVKLLAAMGALLGLKHWAIAAALSIFIAAAIAIIQILRRQMVYSTLANMGELTHWFLRNGPRPHPEINVSNPGLARAPFGVAAALAMCVVVFLP